jgi:uncharacterized protein YggT (Ycf19 family)
MLTVLNLIQLVLYIALLALVGQGALHVLAGSGRASNPFYRVLQWVGSPFTRSLRRLTPQALGDGQVALLTFLLLALLYLVVTVARADWCLSHGLLGQAGCR